MRILVSVVFLCAAVWVIVEAVRRRQVFFVIGGAILGAVASVTLSLAISDRRNDHEDGIDERATRINSGVVARDTSFHPQQLRITPPSVSDSSFQPVIPSQPTDTQEVATNPATQPAAPPQPLASRRLGPVAVDLMECTQIGRTVQCTFRLTNTGTDGLFDIHRSRMVDASGNEYSAYSVEIGNRRVASIWSDGATLVTGVPTRAVATFTEVQSTSEIPLLELVCSFHGSETLQFRRIPMR
jgi:hypothetical protein